MQLCQKNSHHLLTLCLPIRTVKPVLSLSGINVQSTNRYVLQVAKTHSPSAVTSIPLIGSRLLDAIPLLHYLQILGAMSWHSLDLFLFLWIWAFLEFQRRV